MPGILLIGSLHKKVFQLLQKHSLVKRQTSEHLKFLFRVEDLPLKKELPDGYRTIFLLHEVEGYEHQEIAELLDCSVGNSKSQLHKAKLRIRELLGQGRQENGSPRALRTQSRRNSAQWKQDEMSAEVTSRPAFFPGFSQFTASGA